MITFKDLALGFLGAYAVLFVACLILDGLFFYDAATSAAEYEEYVEMHCAIDSNKDDTICAPKPAPQPETIEQRCAALLDDYQGDLRLCMWDLGE